MVLIGFKFALDEMGCWKWVAEGGFLKLGRGSTERGGAALRRAIDEGSIVENGPRRAGCERWS